MREAYLNYMPQSPLRICTYSNCQRTTTDKYCVEHKPIIQEIQKARDKERGNANQRGYDVRWQDYRLIYLRHNPFCISCLKEGKHTEANIVDHVIPHRGDMVLFWDTKNHQSLCQPCHNKKTRQEIEDRKKK